MFMYCVVDEGTGLVAISTDLGKIKRLKFFLAVEFNLWKHICSLFKPAFFHQHFNIQSE